MELIGREELKARLDRGDDFKLVMTMHHHEFEAAHIAGSVKVDSADDAIRNLDPDDEIVVYCSDRACPGRVAPMSSSSRTGSRRSGTTRVDSAIGTTLGTRLRAPCSRSRPSR